jgi:hypothetical protein
MNRTHPGKDNLLLGKPPFKLFSLRFLGQAFIIKHRLHYIIPVYDDRLGLFKAFIEASICPIRDLIDCFLCYDIAFLGSG